MLSPHRRVFALLFPILLFVAGMASAADLPDSGTETMETRAQRGKRVNICEYSRMINNKGDIGMLPGRILELSISP